MKEKNRWGRRGSLVLAYTRKYLHMYLVRYMYYAYEGSTSGLKVKRANENDPNILNSSFLWTETRSTTTNLMISTLCLLSYIFLSFFSSTWHLIMLSVFHLFPLDSYMQKMNGYDEGKMCVYLVFCITYFVFTFLFNLLTGRSHAIVWLFVSSLKKYIWDFWDV